MHCIKKKRSHTIFTNTWDREPKPAKNSRLHFKKSILTKTNQEGMFSKPLHEKCFKRSGENSVSKCPTSNSKSLREDLTLLKEQKLN